MAKGQKNVWNDLDHALVQYQKSMYQKIVAIQVLQAAEQQVNLSKVKNNLLDDRVAKEIEKDEVKNNYWPYVVLLLILIFSFLAWWILW